MVPYVDSELLKKYLQNMNEPIISNRVGLQSILHNVLASWKTLFIFDEVDHMVNFLKLCGLLYCDSKTPLDLKQLIMHRIIPKYSQCVVNADYKFLKEIWQFCILLSRSESRQQQATAYLLFEQMVNLYAPPEIDDSGSYEIRKEANLEGFLLRGLSLSPNEDCLAIGTCQAALNITTKIINFKQPSSSIINNSFIWGDESDAIRWRGTWVSFIKLYELIGEAEELNDNQLGRVKAILNPIENTPHLGMRWVACLLQRGLGNIYPNVRISLLQVIQASHNPDFPFFVIYELPSLLDHDYLYLVNEEDPLQCPFGLEVSNLYYKFLQQGDSRKKRDSVRIVLKLLADFNSARAILFFAHALHRLPRFPLMDTETHKNIIRITGNKAFCKYGDAEDFKVHRDVLLLKVFFNFFDITTIAHLIDGLPTFISVTETMDRSFGTSLRLRMNNWMDDFFVQKEYQNFR